MVARTIVKVVKKCSFPENSRCFLNFGKKGFKKEIRYLVWDSQRIGGEGRQEQKGKISQRKLLGFWG